MTTREALAELHASGTKITFWELRGMLDRGAINRPRMNSSLQYDWTTADLEAVREAVSQRREPARA